MGTHFKILATFCVNSSRVCYGHCDLSYNKVHFTVNVKTQK